MSPLTPNRGRLGISFAASLVEPVEQCDLACWTGGEPPTLTDLLAEEPRALEHVQEV